MVQFRVEESADEEQGRWLWSVYASVFDDYANVETWYEKVWDTHRRRPGFRLACADAGDDIVGFAYGYTGRPGQWWTDNATRVLGPETASAWLGGHFEVVSVGVRPEARGRGIGRGLMQALTSELPHTKLLLMTTSDPSDPARRLYASDGWQVIGPGIGNDTVIMGKLPGGAPSA
jgi:ribosomal protein S18 acetylase RimI-like enzyme